MVGKERPNHVADQRIRPQGFGGSSQLAAVDKVVEFDFSRRRLRWLVDNLYATRRAGLYLLQGESNELVAVIGDGFSRHQLAVRKGVFAQHLKVRSGARGAALEFEQ